MTRRKASRIVHGIQTDARSELLEARRRLEKPTLVQQVGELHPALLVAFCAILMATLSIGLHIVSGWAPEDRVVYRTQDMSTKPGEQPHDSKAARVEAHRLCGGYAQTFDVQDQAVLVYACDDGRLQVLTYMPNNG